MGCENSVNIVPNENLAISGSSSDMVFDEVSPNNVQEEKENVGNSKWTYSTPSKVNPNGLKVPHEYISVEKKGGAFVTPSPTKKTSEVDMAFYNSKLNNQFIDIPAVIHTDIVKPCAVKQVEVFQIH